MCLFAYGQTGTGKTYTMVGPGWDFFLSGDADGAESLSEASGILPRAAVQLFEAVSKEEKLRGAAKVQVACLEIYNDHVMDLLAPGRKSLTIVAKKNSSQVKGLSWLCVSNAREVLECIRRSSEARHTAATERNVRSSRSHYIFQIELKVSHHGEADRISLLSVVDLAGSERRNTIRADAPPAERRQAEAESNKIN